MTPEEYIEANPTHTIAQDYDNETRPHWFEQNNEFHYMDSVLRNGSLGVNIDWSAWPSDWKQRIHSASHPSKASQFRPWTEWTGAWQHPSEVEGKYCDIEGLDGSVDLKFYYKGLFWENVIAYRLSKDQESE